MRDAVRRAVVVICAGVLFLPSALLAQQPVAYEHLPDVLDPAGRYVIYLHGRIIEDGGRRPEHPVFGFYEYDEVLAALGSSGAIVISEQRPPGTDMDEFAGKVVEQVRKLLASGVSPRSISVIGFSKGGGIAIRASALLQNDDVNFVFLAACGSGDFSGWDVTVRGRILSVIEASDEIGRSCAGLFQKAGSRDDGVEVTIETGARHGAFYEPRSEWLNPVLGWIDQG